MMPSGVYAVVIIIVHAVHLLIEIYARVVIKGATLVVGAHIFILQRRDKWQDITFICKSNTQENIFPRVVDDTPNALFVALIFKEEQL